jgi:hypothetical protein
VVRFYMKLDSATPASELEILTVYKGADGVDTTTPVLVVLLDASKNLKVKYRTNAGLQVPAATHAMGTGWHAVELDWTTAAGTGSLTTKVDNVQDGTLSFSSLTNDTATVDFARWGAVGGALAGTGYLMLDDFVSQRTGPIGLTTGCTPNESLTPEPKGFVPVTPCRAYDSRSTTPLTSGVSRDVALSGVAAGDCNIPSNAKSLSMNIAVTGATHNGNLKIYPTGGPVPGASAINFPATISRANNGMIMVGTGGQLTILPSLADPSGQVHCIIDINGYFKN